MMVEVGRVTAQAPVGAGYMPLRVYIERLGSAARREPVHIASASTAPCQSSEPVLQAYAFTMVEQR